MSRAAMEAIKEGEGETATQAAARLDALVGLPPPPVGKRKSLAGYLRVSRSLPPPLPPSSSNFRHARASAT